MIAQRSGRARLREGEAPAEPQTIRLAGRLALPFGAAALMMSLGAPSATADGGAPTDQEIAQAITQGVDFLKSSQAAGGAWNEPSQAQHRLGVTALAGLALMENGVARDDASIKRA